MVSIVREVASTAAVGGPFPESLIGQMSVGPKQPTVLGMLAMPLDGQLGQFVTIQGRVASSIYLDIDLSAEPIRDRELTLWLTH
jgi:hypothetical protein